MIPILMYHLIATPPPKGAYLRGASVHPKRFASQMAWLKRFGYTGLSMRELLPYIRGEKTGKVVGITFDDGYVNVYENALPVLQKHGFTSTVYAVSGQLGGENHWAQQKGALPAKLMSTAQLQAWHQAGMEVGSHTVDHVYLGQIALDEAKQQITTSKTTLEAIIQHEVESFCYPYGNESLDVRALVEEAGYSNATATIRGLAHAYDDTFALPRVSIIRSTHPILFMQKCFTQREEKKRQRIRAGAQQTR